MLSSYLLTPTLVAAPSPSLLSYPSPFYSSASIFQPLQSPLLSPMPSHPPSLDINTPNQLALTPSTSNASSAPHSDMQLPPSALASNSAAAVTDASPSSDSTDSDQSDSTTESSGSSHSLLYTSPSFPFNSHPAILTHHGEDAMLAAADEDDGDEDEEEDGEERIIGRRSRRQKSISLLSHAVDGESSPAHSSALELMEETPSTPNSHSSSPSYYSSTESESSREDDAKQPAPHTSRAGRVSKPSARTKRQSPPAHIPRAKKEKLAAHISSTASTASEQSESPPTPTAASLASHPFSLAPTVMTAAEMAKEQTGGSGLSCHQCKTRKQLDELYTCGNYERKKRATGEEKRNIKPCRKKYCMRCLSKFYGEQPPARRENGTTVLEFECPSCRLICQCAACRKRQQMAGGVGMGDKQQTSAGADKTDGGRLNEEAEAEGAVGDTESDMMEDDDMGDEAMHDGSAAETTLVVSDVIEPSLTTEE